MIAKSSGETNRLRLRTSLYLMSRQYASSVYRTKSSTFSVFDFKEWCETHNDGQPIHPMEIFAIACRAPYVDIILARDAICNFAELEDPEDEEGNPRNWMPSTGSRSVPGGGWIYS